MSDKRADWGADLVAGARAGGEVVDSGRFRLDWTRALDKIKRFQLADPHRYVLEIIQGAVAGGATRIDVATTADDVIIAFNGTRLSGEDLARVFENLFAQGDEAEPSRQLALGVNAALAMERGFVRVDSGDGVTAHRLELSNYDDITVTMLPPERVIDGVRVRVRDRVSWGLFVDTLRGRRSAGVIEAQLIREHCRFAPVPIVVNGTNIATGVGVAAVAEHRFAGQGDVGGALILPASPRRGPNIAVCMNGVEIVRLDAEVATWPRDLGVAGYIDDRRLTRNASHSDIHRDARFTALIATLDRQVRALLDGYVRARLLDGDRSDLDDVDRHYLAQAARALLGRHKRRRRGPPNLGATQEALIEVPGLVELAVEDPTRCALRPVWEAFHRSGVVHTAGRRYSVPLSALPAGTHPVLGPPWIHDVLDGPVRNADQLLQTAEGGQRRRRLREARRRPPELTDREAFVQVPVEGPYGIRGEFGLTARPAATIDELFAGTGGMPGRAHGSTTLVVFLRDGVPLSSRWFAMPVYLGVALLESPAFEPDVSWENVVANEAVVSTSEVLDAAIPHLVEAMAARFDTLPPPVSMQQTGGFSPRSGRNRRVARAIGARWPADLLAADARAQIDAMLASREITRAQAPSLYRWPIFHTVSGRAVSLDQIDGNVAVRGHGVVARDDWGVASAVAWGAPDAAILNVSPQQRTALERQLGRTLAAADARVAKARDDLQRRAAMHARRKIFAPRSDPQRAPSLAASDYEVVIDVVVPEGRGQIGIPRLGVETSWLRPICEGLPLADQRLDTSIPMHAVVSSDRFTADTAFEQPVRDAGYRAVANALMAAQPALVDAFAAVPAARTRDGEDLLWRFLHTVDELPDAVADHPLLHMVDGRRISLRDLAAGSQHAEFRYIASGNPGRQAGDRPIVVCSPKQRRTIARLTGMRGRDYSGELREELAALDRKSRRRQRAVLTEPTLLKVPLPGEAFDGEVGIPAAIVDETGGGGWVDVLIDGVPLERKPMDFSGLPVIAVISSTQLQADKAWKHVVGDATWTRAVEVLHDAVDALVTRATELVGTRTRVVDGSALRIALQRMAGLCFRGRPGAPVTVSTGLQQTIAHAPVWQAAGRRDAVSLRDISEHWTHTRRVWIVDAGRRRRRAAVHEDASRLVLHGGAVTRAALQRIYGSAVHDGTQILERERAASRRRAAAPALDIHVVGITEPSDVIAAGGPEGLAIRAQVAAAPEYARAARGIRAVFGVAGRRLGEHVFAHRLRGVAHIDCTGLRVDADWTAPSDGVQLAWIQEHVAKALWASVAAAVRADATPGDDDRRQLSIDVLVEVLDDRGPADLRPLLMAAPLLRTVDGTPLSPDQVCARKESGEAVHAVSDQLGVGEPDDGRLIIRGDERAIEALQHLVGFSLVRDDTRWRRELERQATRRAFHRGPRVDPITVTAVTDRALLWRGPLDGDGMAGELAIPAAPGRGIQLHVFVDHRHIDTVERPAMCRAIAAVQSAQITPTQRYDGIVHDQALTALERRVQEAVWDGIRQLADAEGQPSPAARVVLIHALAAARRSKATAPAFTRMRDALEQAPLFPDVQGRLWSRRVLHQAIPRGQAIRCVDDRAAAPTTSPDEVVLVVDQPVREPMRRLLRLIDHDDHQPERLARPPRRSAKATGAKPLDAGHIRLLSTLKSLLRDAGGRHFTRSVVDPMRLEPLGRRGDLVRVQEGVVVVNRDHAMWKQVVAADAPDATRHLAVVIVSCLADDRGLYDAASAIGILERLATP